MTDPTIRYERASRAIWRRSATAVVIAPPGEGDVFTLRGSGAALWDALARPSTLDQVVQRLSADFHTDAETVATQIEPVVRELIARAAVVQS